MCVCVCVCVCGCVCCCSCCLIACLFYFYLFLSRLTMCAEITMTVMFPGAATHPEHLVVCFLLLVGWFVVVVI